MDAVERYLDCLGRLDWDGLAATLADDVARDGPFCDVVTGKDAYLAFLRGVVPTLRGYLLTVARVSPAVAGGVAFVELSETFDVNGTMTEYPECVLFETGAGGRITRVSVFMKTPGGEAPVEGGRAS